MRHSEVFDLDQRDEAIARLHELAGERSVFPENQAFLTIRRCYELFLTDDPATRSVLHDDVVAVDHRPVVGGVTIVGAHAVLEFLLGIRAVGVETATLELVAVRGDDHCLLRAHMMGPQGDVDAYQVVVTRDGVVLHSDLFDLDQEGEAVARLHELAATSTDPACPVLHDDAVMAEDLAVAGRTVENLVNQAGGVCRLMNDLALAGDWDGVAALMRPDVSYADRRPLVGGVEMSGVDRGARVRAGGDGQRDRSGRHRGGRGPRRAPRVCRMLNSGPQGAVENAALVVLDADGLVASVDIYDTEQHAEALARLVDLHLAQSDSQEAGVGNAASRYYVTASDRLLARDWEWIEANQRDDTRIVDHRAVVGGFEVVGRDATVAFSRSVIEAGVQAFHSDVVEVSGDHLALLRTVLSGRDGTVEILQVVELAADGRALEMHLFDADAEEDARAHLRERAGNGGAPNVDQHAAWAGSGRCTRRSTPMTSTPSPPW